VELDHLFVMCAVDAPEAAVLGRVGLKEGQANTHRGQGTACRRFPFSTAYLELLWVRDEREALSERTRRTRIWDRWALRGHDVCPFGIVLRPRGHDRAGQPPFPTWAYTPSYLPAGLTIDVAVNTPLTEPEFFYLGFQRMPPLGVLKSTADPFVAPALTAVTIGTPGPGQRSLAARSAEEAGVLSFTAAAEHRMDLTLNGGNTGKTADLRPHLPLVLHW
jgi:hypothetical protein